MLAHAFAQTDIRTGRRRPIHGTGRLLRDSLAWPVRVQIRPPQEGQCSQPADGIIPRLRCPRAVPLSALLIALVGSGDRTIPRQFVSVPSSPAAADYCTDRRAPLNFATKMLTRPVLVRVVSLASPGPKVAEPEKSPVT